MRILALIVLSLLGARVEAAYTGRFLGQGMTLTASATAYDLTGNGDALTGVTRSSYTIIPETSFTNTAFGECIAGSTITLTTRGGLLMIHLQGIASNSTANNETLFTVLTDGGFIHTDGTPAALSSFSSPQGGDKNNPGFLHIHPAGETPAGTYLFCLAARVQAGTGTIHQGSGYYSQFRVVEIP